MRTTHDEGLLQTRIGVVHLRAPTGTPLGRLSGYHGAAAVAVPTGKLYPLVGSKPVVRHDLAFFMRMAPTPQGVYINKPQLSLPMQPGHEVVMCQAVRMDRNRFDSRWFIPDRLEISRLKRPVQP
jgi:hypothetical protein